MDGNEGTETVDRQEDTYLDVIDNNTLRIKQEPKFGFIRAIERSFEVLLPIAVLIVRKYHQGGIGAFKTHVEHALNMNAAIFKALVRELGFDLVRHLVQAADEGPFVLRCIEGRAWLLQLIGPVFREQ